MAGMVQLGEDNMCAPSPRVFPDTLVHSVASRFVGGFSLVESQNLATEKYFPGGLSGFS